MKSTHLLVGIIVLLVVLLAFVIGSSRGGTHVDARDCGTVEQSGWKFKGC